jgi:hypothetical protein
MNSVITWLNGQKTYIGLICLFISGAISSWYTATGWEQVDWIKGIQSLLDYTGYAFGGVGIADKFRKGEVVINKN